MAGLRGFWAILGKRTESRHGLLWSSVLCGVLGLATLGCSHWGSLGGSKASPSLHAFFQKAFDAQVARRPQVQTYLGLKSNRDQLDDRSPEFDQASRRELQILLKELRGYSREALSEADQLSYDLMELDLENQIEDLKWKLYHYPVNQMHGVQSELPSFMINMHMVSSEQDILDYISRLEAFPRVFQQVGENMEAAQKKGVLPPRFVFDKVLGEIRNLQKGKPFRETGENSALYDDFSKKLKSLKLPEDKEKEIHARGVHALRESVAKGYGNLAATLTKLRAKSDGKDGVWKFPKGDEFYKYQLRRKTTTDYTADFIHKLGVLNVERIHGEMRDVMKQIGFRGDLKAFFRFMMTDKQFYLPQNADGEQQYLKLANAAIDRMREALPKMFKTLPKAKIVVKPVEAFRAKTAGLAFYNGPSEDGSRPGKYYVNLSNLKGLPTWEVDALAHHEALPGHHMQISIAQELEQLPKFRRYLKFTAYVEGWGLYSEKLPLQFGFYQDPYANFGRLSMELWRACRLVVDTGIHSKKWSREKAIAYLSANTPSDEGENRKAIDRYIVMPGQATAYMVGMLKILELRKQAERSLGEKFDIRDFHDVVLRNGSVPLTVLEKLVAKALSTPAS